VNLAVHPSGRYAAILHAATGSTKSPLVDLTKDAIASRVSIPEPSTASVSPRMAAASLQRSRDESVHQYSSPTAICSAHKGIHIAGQEGKGIPAGWRWGGL